MILLIWYDKFLQGGLLAVPPDFQSQNEKRLLFGTTIVTFQKTIKVQLSEILGIKKLHTSGFRPQTNGLCERQNRTINQFFRMYFQSVRGNWVPLVPYVQYNTPVANLLTLAHAFALLKDQISTIQLDLWYLEEE